MHYVMYIQVLDIDYKDEISDVDCSILSQYCLVWMLHRLWSSYEHWTLKVHFALVYQDGIFQFAYLIQWFQEWVLFSIYCAC